MKFLSAHKGTIIEKDISFFFSFFFFLGGGGVIIKANRYNIMVKMWLSFPFRDDVRDTSRYVQELKKIMFSLRSTTWSKRLTCSILKGFRVLEPGRVVVPVAHHRRPTPPLMLVVEKPVLHLNHWTLGHFFYNKNFEKKKQKNKQKNKNKLETHKTKEEKRGRTKVCFSFALCRNARQTRPKREA